jgi:phage tail-like protein
MPPTGARVDPDLSYRFKVELDGIVRGGFREASGLDSTIEVVTYAEGGDLASVRKLPSNVTYANISLRWGLATDTELEDWHHDWILGTGQRKNGSIWIIDRQGQETMRWNFFAAWPTKFQRPSFNATANEVAVETLELAHERLERAG